MSEPSGFTQRDAERIEWILDEYPEIATWNDPDGWVDHSMKRLARRIRQVSATEEPTDG